jgi:hypothetical protein
LVVLSNLGYVCSRKAVVDSRPFCCYNSDSHGSLLLNVGMQQKSGSSFRSAFLFCQKRVCDLRKMCYSRLIGIIIPIFFCSDEKVCYSQGRK